MEEKEKHFGAGIYLRHMLNKMPDENSTRQINPNRQMSDISEPGYFTSLSVIEPYQTILLLCLLYAASSGCCLDSKWALNITRFV